MPFDFSPAEARSLQGLVNFNEGLAAEDIVEARYQAEGYDVIARRWRGQGCEIDLIFQGDDGFVFVEVKKSSTFARAAERLTPQQMRRICLAAEEFCAEHAPGQLVNMRLDLAMVDGTGQTDVIPNISI